MACYDLTLGDARSDSGIQAVSGVCSNSQLFADQVNAVTRRLMRRGGWWNTEVLMRLCIFGCRLALPRQVGSLLGIRFCRSGGDLIQVKNRHWAISGYRSCNGWGRNSQDAILYDETTAPCYNEITGNLGKKIRWNVVKRNDVGKTIRIYGFQYGNQPLQEKNSEGVWVPGLTITAAAPFAITTTLVTKITSVVIPVGLEGMSYLYQVDPTSGDMLDLAAYQPRETHPSYRVFHINNICSICEHEDEYGREVRHADALVKLQYVPAVVDEDFIMLSNLDALKLGIQCLRAEEANDDVLSQVKLQLSIKELNMEIRDKNPSEETVIRTNVMGAQCGIYSPI